MFRYNAKVLNVVDGDTFDVEIDLGFHIIIRQRVRLAGVDTPEMNSSDTTMREKAKEAKKFVFDKFLAAKNQITIESVKPADKFGRYLARVQYFDNGKLNDLAAELIAVGLGSTYFGTKREI